MVRLTDMEQEILSSRAEEVQMPIAVYIREQAFGKDIVRKYEIIQDPEELSKLVAQFGKIGSNLNQIARYFNTGGHLSMEMVDEIHDCIDMLFDLREKVLKMGGDYRGGTDPYGKQKF